MCKKEFEAHKASFVENMMIFTKQLTQTACDFATAEFKQVIC